MYTFLPEARGIPQDQIIASNSTRSISETIFTIAFVDKKAVFYDKINRN